jgi:hypothetical protein
VREQDYQRQHLVREAAKGSGGRATAQGRAAHVVALKLDRVFRNTEDALQRTRLWESSVLRFTSWTWAAKR